MFDIAWSEMVVIAIVALVVVGPRDLPPLMRQLGRAIRAFKRMAADFQGQFNDAVKDTEFDSLKKELDDLRRSTTRGFSEPPPGDQGQNPPPVQQQPVSPPVASKLSDDT
jgi:sec-independent protein translocase protein TatB